MSSLSYLLSLRKSLEIKIELRPFFYLSWYESFFFLFEEGRFSDLVTWVTHLQKKRLLLSLKTIKKTKKRKENACKRNHRGSKKKKQPLM